MTTPRAILGAARRLRRFKAGGTVTRNAVAEIYGGYHDFPRCVERDESLLAEWALGELADVIRAGDPLVQLNMAHQWDMRAVVGWALELMAVEAKGGPEVAAR